MEVDEIAEKPGNQVRRVGKRRLAVRSPMEVESNIGADSLELDIDALEEYEDIPLLEPFGTSSSISGSAAKSHSDSGGEGDHQRNLSNKRRTQNDMDDDVQEELACMSGAGVDIRYIQRPRLEVVESSKNRKSTVDENHVADVLPLLTKTAPTAEDKFLVLDARDRLIRLSGDKQLNHLQSGNMGMCPDMCPEKERYERIAHHQVDYYEYDPETKEVNMCLMVKKYARSSADQQMPLCHDLRPGCVLWITMSYLVNNFMDLVDHPGENLGEWYHFLWDRTRSVRKDIVQLELCDQKSVMILEMCARFHIFCMERMREEKMAVFDEKINRENLTKCLQSLQYMYSDLALKKEFCPNEPEFQAYCILLHINSDLCTSTILGLNLKTLQNKKVQFAINVYLAVSSRNYVRFFKLVKSASYLNACILHQYFAQVRAHAMRSIIRAYSRQKMRNSYPISELQEQLLFDTTEDVLEFCRFSNVPVTEDCIILDKKVLKPIPMQEKMKRSYVGVECKRRSAVKEVVAGGVAVPADCSVHHQVHNSFSEDDILKSESWYAEDQSVRVDEMKRKMEHTALSADLPLLELIEVPVLSLKQPTSLCSSLQKTTEGEQEPTSVEKQSPLAAFNFVYNQQEVFSKQKSLSDKLNVECEKIPFGVSVHQEGVSEGSSPAIHRDMSTPKQCSDEFLAKVQPCSDVWCNPFPQGHASSSSWKSSEGVGSVGQTLSSNMQISWENSSVAFGSPHATVHKPSNTMAVRETSPPKLFTIQEQFTQRSSYESIFEDVKIMEDTSSISVRTASANDSDAEDFSTAGDTQLATSFASEDPSSSDKSEEIYWESDNSNGNDMHVVPVELEKRILSRTISSAAVVELKHPSATDSTEAQTRIFNQDLLHKVVCQWRMLAYRKKLNRRIQSDDSSWHAIQVIDALMIPNGCTLIDHQIQLDYRLLAEEIGLHDTIPSIPKKKKPTRIVKLETELKKILPTKDPLVFWKLVISVPDELEAGSTFCASLLQWVEATFIANNPTVKSNSLQGSCSRIGVDDSIMTSLQCISGTIKESSLLSGADGIVIFTAKSVQNIDACYLRFKQILQLLHMQPSHNAVPLVLVLGSGQWAPLFHEWLETIIYEKRIAGLKVMGPYNNFTGLPRQELQESLEWLAGHLRTNPPILAFSLKHILLLFMEDLWARVQFSLMSRCSSGAQQHPEDVLALYHEALSRLQRMVANGHLQEYVHSAPEFKSFSPLKFLHGSSIFELMDSHYIIKINEAFSMASICVKTTQQNLTVESFSEDVCMKHPELRGAISRFICLWKMKAKAIDWIHLVKNITQMHLEKITENLKLHLLKVVFLKHDVLKFQTEPWYKVWLKDRYKGESTGNLMEIDQDTINVPVCANDICKSIDTSVPSEDFLIKFSNLLDEFDDSIEAGVNFSDYEYNIQNYETKLNDIEDYLKTIV